MINKSKILGMSLLVAGIIHTAQARDLSYNNITANYETFTDSSLSVDLDGDGYSFSAMFELTDNLAFTAGLGKLDSDPYMGVTIEQTSTAFGVIAHTEISNSTDLVGSFRMVNIDIEATNGYATISDDDSGNAITFGIRTLASDDVELAILFTQVDIFDDKSNTTALGGKFYVNDTTSLNLGYSRGDDVDTWSFGIGIDM